MMSDDVFVVENISDIPKAYLKVLQSIKPNVV